MQHQDVEHGTHSEHGAVHMPDPSVWPLIVGAAAMFLGLALVWWTRDRSNDFTGPALGGAVVFTLIAAAGWAYEDGRMKRKAEQGEFTRAREARYTQVLTFAIAGGQLDASRGEPGVLTALDRSDSALRDLAGFQDLRIILSPAESGPTQVLVETTWFNREGLATYEETRRTLLDMVNAHPEEVVPGSVQVFDMEVVRDTKDVAFRFGLGAAATVLGSLLIGGFMVGAGLTVFASDNKGGTGGGPATAVVRDAPGTASVVATDNRFSKTAVEAEAGKEFTVNFKNSGKVPHNIHFYDKKGGQTLASGSGSSDQIVKGGETETLKFTVPAAGSYYFQCDFHPDQMNGTLTVK
jgi:plastocyanin